MTRRVLVACAVLAAAVLGGCATESTPERDAWSRRPPDIVEWNSPMFSR